VPSDLSPEELRSAGITVSDPTSVGFRRGLFVGLGAGFAAIAIAALVLAAVAASFLTGALDLWIDALWGH
jgi:hypothetical protein